MRLVSRETMAWLWIDPLRHLNHHVFKTVYNVRVDRVTYSTLCGYNMTVDDVNPMTKTLGVPTCFRCIVAEPIHDVIPSKE